VSIRGVPGVELRCGGRRFVGEYPGWEQHGTDRPYRGGCALRLSPVARIP
jgi:hypothetical protein